MSVYHCYDVIVDRFNSTSQKFIRLRMLTVLQEERLEFLQNDGTKIGYLSIEYRLSVIYIENQIKFHS